jgi:hypothetical protein
MDTNKLVHLPLNVRLTLDAAQAVCDSWENKPRDNVKMAEAVAALKKTLGNFAMGDTRPSGPDKRRTDVQDSRRVEKQ